MSAVVIDTNVIKKSNDSISAPDLCSLACAEALENAREGLIVLDANWCILKEYRRSINASGQPGVGDAFLLWLLNNWSNPARCELVKLTQKDAECREFDEFPLAPELASFDPSDRKFVAVALASQHKPRILNALDTDWWNYRQELDAHGVLVDFLCPQSMPAP